MKKIHTFFHINKTALLIFAGGFILGYIYWYFFGCYWGNYPMSSEWWVNSIYGGLLANILVEIFREQFRPAKVKAE